MLCDIGAGLPLIDTTLHGAVASSHGVQSAISRSEHEWSVAAPYRFDLTVSALRRLSTNLVDVPTPDASGSRRSND
jgi:hypothetical protein